MDGLLKKNLIVFFSVSAPSFCLKDAVLLLWESSFCLGTVKKRERKLLDNLKRLQSGHDKSNHAALIWVSMTTLNVLGCAPERSERVAVTSDRLSLSFRVRMVPPSTRSTLSVAVLKRKLFLNLADSRRVRHQLKTHSVGGCFVMEQHMCWRRADGGLRAPNTNHSSLWFTSAWTFAACFSLLLWEGNIFLSE